MAEKMLPVYLSLEEAAEVMSLSVKTIRRRIADGTILTEIEDPDVAIDTARVHLDGVRDAALDVYRLLNAARNETAHIAVAGRPTEETDDIVQDTPKVPRPEHRQPPTVGGGGPGPGLGW